MREPRRLTNLWAFTACYRDSFTFLFNRVRGETIRWFDHVKRMDRTKMPEGLYYQNLKERDLMEQPETRWFNHVLEDIKNRGGKKSKRNIMGEENRLGAFRQLTRIIRKRC
jgi:hypothetical protein